VTKLVESLEATEKTLKEVAAMKNIDLGIASLYRVVQGLPEEEQNRAQKKQMMEIIFQANLDMQKRRSTAP
jgi:transposase